MSSKEPPALKQKRVLSVPMNESKGNVETEGNSSDIYREAKSHNARDSSHKSLHLRRWEMGLILLNYHIQESQEYATYVHSSKDLTHWLCGIISNY